MNQIIMRFCLLWLFSLPLFAQENIPKPIQEWQAWVLDGSEYLECPFINHAEYMVPDSHLCAWPSALVINANDQGAAFEQAWNILEESIIPLPGDGAHWPHSVLANNQPVPIIRYKDGPAVQLKAGTYRITGQFNWNETPESILIPSTYPLVNLTINQQEVPFPKIESGELWFQQSEQSESVQDSIEINVARHVTDGPYIKLETYLALNVSGKSREIALGKALPEGFKLSGIEGEVPAFLDAEGTLYAKLKPGEWELNILAYAPPELLSWKRPEISNQWPNEEIWVFSPEETLRIGKLSGARVFDSSQAYMPDDWYDLPSYLVTPQDVLTYDIQHRGKPLHLENQLSLERTLWLSFDNSLYTFNDRLTGNMLEDWRLQMPSPFVLESAEDQDGSVLITTLEQDERGVENRYPDLNIKARGIINYSKELPVTGWDSDFESVSITLNVPPGNKLFAVFGADRVTDSWWGNWSIWSSFIVLLASIAAGRLISLTAGIATGIMLLFIYQEGGAPIVAVLNLIIAITINKHQPFERLKPWINAYWMTSAIIAVGAILFFSATQIRSVIHPQLEQRNTSYASGDVFDMFGEPDFAGVQFSEAPSNTKRRIDPETGTLSSYNEVERMTVTGSRLRKSSSLERYQSDALIQAGSGVPNWKWNQHKISWSSPVAKGQTFDIVMLSASLNRFLKILSILVIIGWLYLVSKDALKAAAEKIKQQHIAATCVLFLLSPLYSQNADASDLPNQALLDELKTRLTEAPLCAPSCASINHLEVSANTQQLTLKAQIHAYAETAIALPRSEFWRAEQIKLNQEALQTSIKVNKWIYIPVPKGISELSLVGRLAPVENLQLRFLELPKSVAIKPTEAWEIVGTNNGILNGNTLEFLATVKQQADEQTSTRYNTQPYVQITRELSIDQLWKVTTTVERIAPTLGSVNVRIPLLAGERVISGETTVENNHVVVTIPAGEEDYEWYSSIGRQSLTTFTASNNQNYIEEWQIIASPSWHVELSGLPMVYEEPDGQDYFTYIFYPQAEETLTIETTRPEAVKGDVLAIDSAKLDINQGTRTSTLNLSFTYRSTRGGEHTIDLPAEYQLKEVRTDGKLINLQPEAGKLSIPVAPGKHEININMRANTEEAMFLSPPAIHLNAPTSNMTTKVNLSNQRWILWVDGPILGPAILYWVEFLAFIVIAALLSRVKFSPLNTVNWIILGVGLSLNNWGILMLTAIWFASITASQYRPKTISTVAFNFTQLVLYGLSVIAIISLITIVPISLLSSPSMGIEGYQSYGNHLSWFADKSDGTLPEVNVVSISTWFYKAIMLIWVIWLSISFISWIKWAWRTVGKQGYWRSKEPQTSSN